MNSLHTILYQLSKDDSLSLEGMTPEAMTAYRQTLAAIAKAASIKMAQASRKPVVYEEYEIKEYIAHILDAGKACKAVALSDVPDMEGAQKLKRYTALIQEAVEASCFSTTQFKIHALRFQRSAIAQSKTLHELRKAVSLMIGPLALWREHQDVLDEQETLSQEAEFQEIEGVLKELEVMTELAADRGRVISELMSCYDEDAGDIALLKNCEAAKIEHSLTDEQVSKMFGITRKQLRGLRGGRSVK